MEVSEMSEHPTVFKDCKYLVIIPMPSEEASCNAIMKIMKKSPYKDAYIDVDIDEIDIVDYSKDDQFDTDQISTIQVAEFAPTYAGIGWKKKRAFTKEVQKFIRFAETLACKDDL